MSDTPRRRVNVRLHAPQQINRHRHLVDLVGPLVAAGLAAGLASLLPVAAAAHCPPVHPRQGAAVPPHHAVAAATPASATRPRAHARANPPARSLRVAEVAHGPWPSHPLQHRRAEPPAAAAATRLPGFWRALAAVERGRRRDPVVVLQIGDSHSANDAFSGRLRELFQARFGAAGRGVLPAGIPYPYFRPAGVQVTASGWDRIGGKPVLPGGDPPPPFIGVVGSRMHAARAAEMTYRVDAPADLQRVAIEILQQPGGGTLAIGFDDRPTWLLGTAAAPGRRPQAAWITLPKTAAAHTLTLRAQGDGPVDLLAVDLRRAPPTGSGGGQAGVIWANLGTIGAQVSQVTSWDPDIVAADLRALHPDLILLAFGTNEGFSAGLDAAAYAATYAEAARRLARTGATLAVIEPPDGNRRVPTAAAAAPGSAAVAFAPASPAASCGPAAAEPGQPAGTWEEPPALALVRHAQAAVAARSGWFSWDWSAAMGGPCSIARWAAATPPLAWPDHVHLREAGARQTAEALFSALLSGYGRSGAPGP